MAHVQKYRSPYGRWLAALVGLSLMPFTLAQSLTNDQLQQVVDRLADGAKHSWELGTRAQALLELNAPLYSVFSGTSLPPPHSPSSTSLPADITDVVAIADNTISQLKNTTVPQPLVADDGAAGDPASIGVAVLVANWTNPAAAPYSAAAANQLEFLLTSVPRTSDGAISHRQSQVQLWSDFVYMVPPFLAYYGVMTQNQSLVTEAYNQIKLYRSYLLDPDADNLWRHIELGTWADNGHWSTGNSWAAAGILRVLATIVHSNLADQFQSERTDLENWAVEILDGMYRHVTSDHLFYNYADNSSTFTDASSTALIAAATYRLAILTKTYDNIRNAEKCRIALSNGSHLDGDGWLTPVVNPENTGAPGAQSPEGQAFVVEMQAAWRDWVASGSPGSPGSPDANAAARTQVRGATAVAGAVLAIALALAAG